METLIPLDSAVRWERDGRSRRAFAIIPSLDLAGGEGYELVISPMRGRRARVLVTVRPEASGVTMQWTCRSSRRARDIVDGYLRRAFCEVARAAGVTPAEYGERLLVAVEAAR